MRSRWVVNGLLLVLVLAGGWYAWQRSQAPGEPQHKLSQLDPAAIGRIVIEPEGGERIALEKRADGWWLQQPLQGPADRIQVDQLTALLRIESKEQLAATDLARFSLDRPALKISFDDQVFAFGTTNPLTQDQYVAAGDSVYLIPGYHASMVPTRADRLLTRSLLAESEKPMGFVLEDFRITQHEGKWLLAPPLSDKERPSQDDLNRWVDGWRQASSMLTAAADPAKKPNARIRVQLADGKTVVFEVLQTQPELLLRRPDLQLQYLLPGESARQLLAHPVPVKEGSGAGAS